MSEGLQNKKAVYPLIGIGTAALLMIIGMLMASETKCIYFLLTIWLLFAVFGYGRACLAIIPMAAILSGFFSGVTYAISKDAALSYAAANRMLTVCVAVIPGLAMSTTDMVRSFSKIKVPRMLTLGMMITLQFFPLLKREIKQVREAMKTRGAGSLLSPQILYRAFFIPLLIRLVNISDTLALSVETRGFQVGADAEYTIYKEIDVQKRDFVFVVMFVMAAAFFLFGV